jgi:hypothetical protein
MWLDSKSEDKKVLWSEYSAEEPMAVPKGVLLDATMELRSEKPMQ